MLGPLQKPRHQNSHSFQKLEHRNLLAGITLDAEFLHIQGTNADDVAEVVYVGDSEFIAVSLSGFAQQIFSSDEVSRIIFRGADGNDQFTNQTDLDSTAFGHKGDDTLIGGGGHNRFWGGFGDDHLTGGNRNDFLRGREGNDTIYGGMRHDKIFGGDGDDLIFAQDGDDIVRGNDGNDVIHGNSGKDRLIGGLGNDELWGSEDRDRLFGEEGDDLINAGDGDDVVGGGAGNDELFGNDGNDQILGGDGDDLIAGDAGNDRLFGENGNDQIFGDKNSFTTSVSDAGNDLLDGGAGNDLLRGIGTSDILYGRAGDDDLRAGDIYGVNSLLIGGLGNDRLSGRGTLRGSGGNDLLTGSGILSGENGDDSIAILGGTAFGGAGDDSLTGYMYSDILFGGEGNDRLQGRDGTDQLYGEAGNDLIFGGAIAPDVLSGGEGTDLILRFTQDELVDESNLEDAVVEFSNSVLEWRGYQVREVVTVLESMMERAGGSPTVLGDSISDNPITFVLVRSDDPATNRVVNGRRYIEVNWWEPQTDYDLCIVEDFDSPRNARAQATYLLSQTWDSVTEIENRFEGAGDVINQFREISQWGQGDAVPSGFVESLDGEWYYAEGTQFVDERGMINPFEDWSTVWEIAFDSEVDQSEVDRLSEKLAVIDDFFDFLSQQ